MTPAAERQLRADAQAAIDRLDAGMLRVLTVQAPQPGPIPCGEAAESDLGALDEPLRRHFEDEPCYRDAAEDDMRRARDAERDEALFKSWPAGDRL